MSRGPDVVGHTCAARPVVAESTYRLLEKLDGTIVLQRAVMCRHCYEVMSWVTIDTVKELPHEEASQVKSTDVRDQAAIRVLKLAMLQKRSR